MKNKELIPIVEATLPKLYSYARVISSDDSDVKELLSDAYTAVLLKDKKMIQEEKVSDSEDRIFFRDYFFMRLLNEISVLGIKKQKMYVLKMRNIPALYRDFYALNLLERLALFLEKHLEMSQSKIAEVLSLKRFEVVQLLFLAKKNILKTGKESHSEARR